MKTILKRNFGLTDSGIRMVRRAALASFFVNVGYMALMLIAMYYGDNVLKGVIRPAWYYLAIIAVTLAVLYILIDREYVLTFNGTYQEATNLRLEIADQIKKLPLSYFSRHDLSDLAQTIMQDVTDLEHAMSHSIPRCIAYVFFLTVMAVLLLVSNPLLGLAALIPLVVGLVLMLLSQRAQKRWTEKYFWKMRETTEAFQEAIELQREIKSCRYEDKNYQEVSASLDAAERLRVRTELMQSMPILLSTAVMKLSIGFVAAVSAALLRINAVQMIYVIGFLLVSMRLTDAVGVMEDFFAEFFYLDARIKRIGELRNTPTQQGKNLELEHFDIELKDVRFAYNDETKVINGVSFVAKQDQVTAIVGPSGCGKSTILRLISRLYDYDGGSIRIDGHDIQEISTDALFDKVSFVFQDVILFNSSVLDNIRMGRLDATDEEVRQAARLANCEDFILRLPEGYDTLIGENGSKLSGGERQRISIARALLKNAPILLLDEISASLDVENERKIQEALNRLITDKTVIIVSHRLKSIEKADQIVVMDAGRVEAAGTHDELMKKSPLYQRLIEKSSLTEKFTY
ncbi:ABC transporter, ATP-binding protein [Shuttleworthella sp. MSX8B]|uniref:ABC transporter ATP-binding protein n=1 Tax=Shuttleworthella sp. MSX8B TaxID=936574 RepID=UPI00044B5573|nr:ABC transporter ATP-binding protein [Shuttleworthia sp. MSX8B]EUB12768.1 ABC transporter, ATP-binding protein [Shuttleworthia sp. MSX8B]